MKNDSLKIALIVAVIAIAGYFLYTTMTNRQAGQTGMILGSGDSVITNWVISHGGQISGAGDIPSFIICHTGWLTGTICSGVLGPPSWTCAGFLNGNSPSNGLSCIDVPQAYTPPGGTTINTGTSVKTPTAAGSPTTIKR